MKILWLSADESSAEEKFRAPSFDEPAINDEVSPFSPFDGTATTIATTAKRERIAKHSA
jgi:hypothetical protein